jgi:nucleolar GTP-binding protein
MSKARKIAFRVKPDKEVTNARNRARKHGAETLNALTQALCLPLRDTVAGYKSEWRRLHPFERVVADLTAAARQKKDGLTLEQVLEEIHEARKMILEAGKDWIAKVKNAETAREAGQSMQEGKDGLFELFQTYASPAVSGLVELQRSLRSAPIVQLDTPAVVLVGSPNVGKSSIVRAISSGTPEVNNYPFTTRGMTLGHVEVFWGDHAAIAKAVVPDPRRRPGSVAAEVVTGKYAFSQLCQVMDSPGLLVRPDAERNEMEALTLAAMQHLPTAVCYVMDLSGGAGDKCSSVEHQLALRREVRSRFPKRPWIDVVSKIDLGLVDGAIEDLEEILRQDDGTMVPYVKLSIHEGVGVNELRAEILRMLGEVRVVLDVMAAKIDRPSP